MSGLTAQLDQAQDALAKLLTDAGWPVEPVAIFDRLRQERHPRAAAAMIALLRIQDARLELCRQTPDIERAATATLQLGLLAANLGIQLQSSRAQMKRSKLGVDARRQQRRPFVDQVMTYFERNPRHSNRRAALHFLPEPERTIKLKVDALAKCISRARKTLSQEN